MEYSALILGIVGTVLAAVSLGWNIASYFLSAGRIKVNLLVGLLGAESLVSWPAAELKRVPFDDFPGAEPVVVIEVVNTGRLAFTVTGVGIYFGAGGAYRATGGNPFPPLPHRMDGGEIASWALPMRQALVAGLMLEGQAATLHARGEIAGPKIGRSKSVSAAKIAKSFSMDLSEVRKFEP